MKYGKSTVTVLGNLTRDPAVNFTPKGTAVCEMSVAVNERQGTGETAKDVVTFVDVVQYGNAAESSGKYLAKGSSVCIFGRLKLDQWDDKTTGQKRTKLRVIADDIRFLSTQRPQTQTQDAPPRPASASQPPPAEEPEGSMQF